MDGQCENLYFYCMRNSRTRPLIEPAPAQSAVPAFFLYGEALRPPDERMVHIETVAARSRLHDWTIRPHRHRDLHQVLMLEHGGVQARIDGRDRRLHAPAAIIVPPGVIHSFQFQPETRGLVISFSATLARDLGAANPALPVVLERSACTTLNQTAMRSTDLASLGEMLLREFGRSALGRQLALRGLLAALLANLLRLVADEAHEAATPHARDRELVARFREQFEQRFREHAAVRDYAARLQTSETRLRRACLLVAGQSPTEMIHLRLLLEAERQLRYTSMPVAQVAYYLGFEDPAYFTRFFTRRMRLSPRAFRQRDALTTPERNPHRPRPIR